MPRYHTNLASMIEALLLIYDVKLFVFSYTRKEQMNCDIEMIDLSLINNRYEFYESFISKYNPEITIIRWDSDMLDFDQLIKILRKYKTEIIPYEQTPKFIALSIKDLKQEILSLFFKLKNSLPMSCITPIAYNRRVKKIDLWYKKAFNYPIEENQRKEYFNSNKVNILLVGKFRQSLKRHDWVLLALEKINFSGVLTLIGEYPEKDRKIRYEEQLYLNKLFELIDNSAIEIKVYKNIPHFNMNQYYENSDILLMPSERETLGFSLLEGMASGCAVIVSDNVGAACYVEDNKNGLIFKSYSYADFEEKLYRLISDRTKIVELGKSAQEYISLHHNYDKFRSFIK